MPAAVDVLVVGAGPAGVAAAIELHRAGVDVLVVDKAVFPRDKCCGDGLTTLALRELAHLGLDVGAVPQFQRVDAAVLRGPSGGEVTLALPTGHGLFAAVTPRLELDAALVEHATRSGVTVLQGHGLEDLDVRAEGVVAVIEGHGTDHRPTRRRRRRHVEPDAQGARARTERDTSANGMPSASTSTASPARPRDQLIVWFDDDFLPGYAWSFPLPDGRANVGFGIRRGTGRRTQDMKQTWATFFERPHVAAALGPGARPGRPTPGVADPGPHRHGDALARAGAVHRRCRRRHRRDDRRRHRPGAADRPAGGRGDRGRR